MTQADRSVVLLFDYEAWATLENLAVTRGKSPRDFVMELVDEVIRREWLRLKLYHPEDAVMILDGIDADNAGSAAVQRLADIEGVTIEVVGGERHDGKVFKPKG